VVKAENDEQLTAEEMFRFEANFRAFHRNMDNQLWQYRRGFLGENIPRSVRNAVRGVVGASATSLALWDRQKVMYTDECITFVEEAIADLRSPEP
jgi:hypothetical protein